jgi:opacity protein-like surface antigen
MRLLLAAMLLASVVLPAPASADRGALTLEAGPALTWWPSMPPAVGSGAGINGSAAGGVVGVRYGLRNNLELTASGFYEAHARYTHPGVTVETDAGAFTGTLSSETSRWGLLAGARYVTGLALRFYVGAEVGWSQQSYTKLDLINVSDPSNPHSFGLGLTDRTRGALVVAPLAGVEWQVTDRWSVSCTPKVQVMLGDVGRVAVVLPLTVGYSWYGL